MLVGLYVVVGFVVGTTLGVSVDIFCRFEFLGLLLE